MTISDFKILFTAELSGLYPTTEIQSFFSILMDEYLGWQRIDLVTNPNREVLSGELNILNKALNRLKLEEPIQYILGKTEFYGLPFLVNSDVLIPRPETEELVEWVLGEVAELHNSRVSESQSLKISKSLKILDIGTGSGCIPIVLKKQLPSANVSAIDVSKAALQMARQNAHNNEVGIHFIERDILKASSLDEKYDIIVSNPPYVRELEKAEMSNNVLNNEPELALFVDNDNPLIFYRKIAELAKEHLTQDGMLFFEINEYLGKEMLELLRLLGFRDISLKKDLFGRDRMIKASKT